MNGTAINGIGMIRGPQAPTPNTYGLLEIENSQSGNFVPSVRRLENFYEQKNFK
jgi:hypothetical protein